MVKAVLGGLGMPSLAVAIFWILWALLPTGRPPQRRAWLPVRSEGQEAADPARRYRW
jgi:hypothetical protein